LLSAVVAFTLLGLWAARALTAPLSAFAKAAENFSLDGSAPLLPERGPEEIRSVAKALNRMRQRITALIDNRTKMLAAISHDLRTPITRMRLRSEFIEDEGHRSRMLHDLDQMRSMLESVLSFLRNDRKLESMTLVDIASTLQLIADQFADMGYKVAYEGPEHAMTMARPDDLHRCVTNLVENAVRFGAEINIRRRANAGPPPEFYSRRTSACADRRNPPRSGRKRRASRLPLFENSHRLERVIAGAAMPEIGGAVRAGFDPVGEADRLTALGAGVSAWHIGEVR